MGSGGLKLETPYRALDNAASGSLTEKLNFAIGTGRHRSWAEFASTAPTVEVSVTLSRALRTFPK